MPNSLTSKHIMEKLLTLYVWSVKVAILLIAVFLIEGCMDEPTRLTVTADFDEVQGVCDAPDARYLTIEVDLEVMALPQVPTATCVMADSAITCSYTIGEDVARMIVTIPTGSPGLLIIRSEAIAPGAVECTWRYKVVEWDWS